MKRVLAKSLVAGALLTAAAWASAATTVVVLPFSGSTPDPARDAWIGPAVQQNMIVMLAQSADLRPMAYQGKIAGLIDPQTAARAATASQAKVAVYGTYEVVGEQVRLRAQVVDAATGQSVATAQARGGLREMLRLEDQLAEQTRGQIGTPAATASVQTPPATPQVQTTGTFYSQPAPSLTYYPSDYGYYSSYPYYSYYSYSYPYYYPSFGLGYYWGGYYGHRYHHHGWNHGGWNGNVHWNSGNFRGHIGYGGGIYRGGFTHGGGFHNLGASGIHNLGASGFHGLGGGGRHR